MRTRTSTIKVIDKTGKIVNVVVDHISFLIDQPRSIAKQYYAKNGSKLKNHKTYIYHHSDQHMGVYVYIQA